MSAALQQVDTKELSGFLEGTGWESATIEPLSADMGLRRYYKLTRREMENKKSALLMDMSRAGILETGLEAFVKVAAYFKKHDIRVPEIYYEDPETGLAIIELLSGGSFGDAVKSGGDKNELYGVATDVLIKIRQASTENTLELTGYKETLIWERLGQFVEYYLPVGAGDGVGRPATQSDYDEFNALWQEIEKSLPPCPMGMCHADYHLENLIWTPSRQPQYGLIDFQDAFWGFIGYDLLNLLEDARQSAPSDIKKAMMNRYCQAMSAEEREIFEQWYVVMSAQFHCRVIGLFIKFSHEKGTNEFLAHIPRLQGYIANNLQNPILSPLKEFVQRHNISLDITI